jgi:hypothetical protein
MLASIVLVLSGNQLVSAQSIRAGGNVEPSAADFCDLFREADECNGKALRIDATYELGTHMATFYNEACISPSGLRFVAKATFADDHDGAVALNKISKLLKRSRSNEARVTAIAEFRMENPAGSQNGDFARYTLEVKRLLVVEAVKPPT